MNPLGNQSTSSGSGEFENSIDFAFRRNMPFKKIKIKPDAMKATSIVTLPSPKIILIKLKLVIDFKVNTKGFVVAVSSSG